MARKPRLGSRVRKLRSRHGLTQVELAARLGISASYLNLIEHNQRALTVPLLLKLGQLFEVDLQEFAEGDQAHLLADLTEVFGDALFEGHDVKPADLQDLVAASPELSRAVVALYRGYRQAQGEANTLAERLSDRGLTSSTEVIPLPADQITDFLQENMNYFPTLEAAAQLLWQEAELDGENLYQGLVRYLQSALGVEVQVVPTHASGGAVRRYDQDTKRLFLSEMIPPSSRTFQLAHQIGMVTQRANFDDLMRGATLSTADSDALCRVALANYFAGAVVMPYEPLLNAARALRYDVELLQERFAASFEQVSHRLTNLNNPAARGVPLHLIRVDMAGNISKRFNGSGIRLARYGGACPRWNVHEAFMTPGLIRTQLSRQPGGQTYFCIARSLRKAGGGYHVPQSIFAIGLGCEISHARELVYADGIDLENPGTAVPIGPGCRLCERLDCRQRAFPPIRHHPTVDENVRGLSAYVSAGTGVTPGPRTP
jgi:predicted transcriptional regulator/transcriptional regulator with XRE-family HTH domain